jgi:hypothetical protein
MRESRYVLAGSPTCCQRCSHPFAEICIRGNDNRYYCSEICAQIELKVDLADAALQRRFSIAS